MALVTALFCSEYFIALFIAVKNKMFLLMDVKKNKLCINFQHMQENAENVPSIFIQMNLRFFRFLCNK